MSHMRHICAASVLILIPRPRYQPKSKAVHIIVYTCLCSHRIPCPTCSTYVPQIIPRPEYQPKREARALVNHDTLYGRAGPCSTLQCTYLSCKRGVCDSSYCGVRGPWEIVCRSTSQAV
ncbi:hypothetical protein K443DRAFT_312926 [Laccaria amethystina LaAM-08-1]|uniref:Uncharacterized protein n=1 Tax=Laccaria amethystina LaAM-08-1 TaxID=1095629 RepID=A0A0C9XIF2_9AGAR|nr:hypothetical protein K443DRAFT_312926 [Laccaria amethystina LaAM-08-1]